MVVLFVHPFSYKPFLVVGEYFHAWFRVRVVGRLEPQLLYAQLREEGVDHADTVS